MERSGLPLLLGALAVALVGCEAPEREGGEDAASELGTVTFPTSCSEEVQPDLERGLLLLHHMMYARAEETFLAAADAERECAIAHWGVAMARFQPLWGSADVEAGRTAAERAVELEPPTERERIYARAALAFYEDPDAAFSERVRSWEAAMEELHRNHSDDPEAASLYALAHLAVGPDQAERQERATAILEEIHDRMPRHPGAIHYAIHAHDVEGRGQDGVPFARAYREIAPSIPHSLHMPSHIYVRTGAWEQVIEWNRRSADAALEHPAGDRISLHYPHALDYLMYAYLQRGEHEEASGVLEELRSREGCRPHLATN
jgi:pentatricopeptide repeat protein